MRILVDADACPVVKIVESVAMETGIPVLLVYDNCHVMTSTYAEKLIVDKGADAADFALISHALPGDLVITQDYGVAAMALGKGARALHQSGREFTNYNIDQMLFERYLSQRARRGSAKYHGKGPKKRTSEDNVHFEKSLRRIIGECL